MKWKTSPDKCPTCDKRTQWLTATDWRGTEYIEAEQCVPCGWRFYFKD
jgi:Zn ribbon nucleic-acid-binding protein